MTSLALNLTSHASPMRSSDDSVGGRMVSTDGRALLLAHSTLRAEARGGVCRVVLVQRFENPHDEALEVTYSLPLPSDGAVSGFAFEMNDARVVGVVDKKARARERYLDALEQGKTAALLEQVRSSVFTQKVGNLPPRTALTAEITVDQPLAWLDEGAWEWRFPTVVGARYVGESGRVSDARALAVEVSDRPMAPRLAMELHIGDAVVQGCRPESSSHPIEVTDSGLVTLRDGRDVRLDRDVVVRWSVARPGVGLSLHVTRGEGDVVHALLTMVPPVKSARERKVARDLVVLLDTSGSMGGAPLAQARRVVGALLDSLDEDDCVELIEFSDRPRRWESGSMVATGANVRRAHAWLSGLRASGSTEMRAAILEALAPLRDGAQRQVVLVTDGYIGFEREIVETLYKKLPVGCRLHTVGVGSSVNRSLTQPGARAGRGVEIVIGNDEDPERAVARILSRTASPIVTELSLEGDALRRRAPSRMPDLFQGAPVVVALELDARASSLTVRGITARGRWSETLEVPEIAKNSGTGAVSALFAREAVEDCEMHLAAGGNSLEIDPKIEALGVDFQIATRLTSWVAVTEARTVREGAPMRRETVAQELPHGVSAEGLGLRAPIATALLQTRTGSLGGSFETFARMAGVEEEEALTRSGAMPAMPAYYQPAPSQAAPGAPSAPFAPGGAPSASRSVAGPSPYAPMPMAQSPLPMASAPTRSRRSPFVAVFVLLLLLVVALVAYLFARPSAPVAPARGPAQHQPMERAPGV